MTRSRYDELHDQFHAITTSKSGTRYERLAALMFKILDESNTVIHDLKLAGDSEVKHQIDVTIERDGKRRRVLVECKDFDVGGGKVGLGITRDFFAVVEDTKPDEAVILTCNDFTRDAAKYAKAKGIKLAVMRAFAQQDWEGRIREIKLALRFFAPSQVSATPKLSEDAHTKLVADMAAAGLGITGLWKGAPVFVVDGGVRTQFNEFVEGKVNAYPADKVGPVTLDYSTPGLSLEVESRGPVPMESLIVTFTIHSMDQNIDVEAGVASLLVSGLGSADLVVFEKDLRRFRVDGETGEVVPIDA